MTTSHALTTLTPIVSTKDSKVFANSRDVAAYFGKRHADTLRAIDKLECSRAFNERNFALVEYEDAKGETRRSVDMTKDGFAFLVMGFTGAKAGRFKEDYIAAFNEMEATLKAAAQVPALPNFSDPAEAAIAWAAEYCHLAFPISTANGSIRGTHFAPHEVHNGRLLTIYL